MTVRATVAAALIPTCLLFAPAMAEARQPKTVAAPASATDSLQSSVESNVRSALASLNSAQDGSAARAQRFRTLMTQFADVNAVSESVLGRYSGRLSDPALRRDWEAVFADYAFATYESRLDQFRGHTVRATAVTINTPGRDAMVTTELTPPNATRPIVVQWRMLNRGAGWKVYDVLVNLRGNELWLGQRQKRQFEAELDKTRGDVRALMTVVQQDTAKLRNTMRR